MKLQSKSSTAYKTIGEITKELGLVDKKTGSLQTHTLRYWETRFKQLRPIIKAGRRRYYSKENLVMLKMIKTLLKDKGYTINGVKRILSKKKLSGLDANDSLSINKPININTDSIKNRLRKINSIIKELKKVK